MNTVMPNLGIGIHDFFAKGNAAQSKSWMPDQVRHDGMLERHGIRERKSFAELFQKRPLASLKPSQNRNISAG